jgi:hypothetical protein
MTGAESERPRLFVRSVRRCVTGLAQFDSSWAAYLLFVPAAWPLLAALVVLSAAVGLFAAVPHYLLSRRDLAARRQASGWEDVSEARVRPRGQDRYVRPIRLGGSSYELHLSARWDRQKGVLVSAPDADTAWLTFPDFPHWPGTLRQRLRKQGLTGTDADGRCVTVTRDGRAYVVRTEGLEAVYRIGERAVTKDGTPLAVRDVLGWRVAEAASHWDRALCALILAARLPRLV